MTELLQRPQPLGVFGDPAGFLLVPTGGTDDVRQELLAGRLPQSWPDALRGHQLVHTDDLVEAVNAFSQNDPIARYNRWVLDPSTADPDQLRSELPPDYAALVDVVAWTHGIGPVPEPKGPTDAVPAPEVATLVLACRATSLLGTSAAAHAAMALMEAAQQAPDDAPALAGMMFANAGMVAHDHGDSALARTALTAGIQALSGSDLHEVTAELRYRLGVLAHEESAATDGVDPTLLQTAIKHYYDALQLIREDTAPELWAAITMNLAIAHLATPMTRASDQLRLGVATSGLRAARRVFDPARHRSQWATATINLANALVYTPSTHQLENLVEAVGLYEEVLSSGVRDHDAQARARLLTNLGNCLAHLGTFDEATAALVEARFLFEQNLDHDSVLTVRGILDEIAKAGVSDEPGNPQRQAEQMSRLPRPEVFTSGASVTITKSSATGDQQLPPGRPRVTVLPKRSQPEAQS